MNKAVSEHPAKSKNEGFFIALVLLCFIALVTAWLRITPPGLWQKLSALGYSVCHQMTDHSFQVNGHAFPLCARCTGMFFGAVVGVIYQFRMGKKGSFPPTSILYILAFFVAAFGIDGINSLTQLFPWAKHLYETTNIIRLISGTGMGLVISAIIAPAFNQSIWRDVADQPALDHLKKLVNLLLILSVLLLGIVGEYEPVMYFAAVGGGISVFLLISLLYTAIAVMLLRRDGQNTQGRQLILPVLIGMCFAMIQICGMTLLRFSITQTWLPINL